MTNTFKVRLQDLDHQLDLHVERYDYENQAWTTNWIYMPCNHPAKLDCDCYGRVHADEFAAEFKARTMARCRDLG